MLPKLTWPILVILLFSFSYTSAWAEPARVKQAAEKTPILFKEGAKGREAYLKTIKNHFDNNKVGEIQKGWFCSKIGNILWNRKAYSLFGAKLPAFFREELEKAHYPVPPDKIFDAPANDSKASSGLQVGMLFKEIRANFCVKSDGVSGGVYMKVYWEVYSPEAQRVIFETTTEGTYQPAEMVKIPLERFFHNAFGSAVRNLLAEQGYHDVVANMASFKPISGGSNILKLKKGNTPVKPLKDIITDLRSAVVTITSDTRSGSGFFVSQDGDLLTNLHVVGSSKFVKVKLPTGRELLGEVLRSDKNRDVALIRTEPIAVHPIIIADSEPNIGEDVYVLGSPLGDKFNTSLTHGILSGYRTFREKRYLQSDVAILPGNSGGPLLDSKGSVVGISVAGLGAKGLAGMNFFIPINDALTNLNIVIE
ncbi:MAG: trypsin-like peptidase domain-containing protein [Syntrophales bacterium]|nr:trypsin-like peptidase domain-containing protein [Syntrophales bacterium]